MFRWGEHLEALCNGVSVLVNETHHFGTYTILLADFCLPVKGKQAAELGAGCGAISMIWLREQPPAHITAVEIAFTGQPASHAPQEIHSSEILYAIKETPPSFYHLYCIM